MKKLLSILASVSMVATAGAAVVACSTDKADDSDMTGTIFQDSALGSLKSEDIINDLLKNGDNGAQQLFGDHGTAAKTFMNYFAEGVMKYINSKKPEDLKKLMDPKAIGYLDDGTLDKISKDWDAQGKNADSAWDKKISDAKDSYGKKWESKLLDDLKSQFGKQIYDDNGKKYTPTKYEDYKKLFRSYSILNGDSNGKSLYQVLLDDVYGWTKAPASTSIDEKHSQILSYVFKTKQDKLAEKVKDTKVVDFSQAKLGGKDAFDNADEKSWVGQMKLFLDQFLKLDSKDPDYTGYQNYIIDMYNITGGLNADGKTPLVIANINWANADNIKDQIKDTTKAAQDLITRLDGHFENDFGTDTGEKNLSLDNLTRVNRAYDISNKISSIYNDKQNSQSGSSILGLFSNAQRYVANDYLKMEKPVAVTEMVISPLYGSPDYSQLINNSGYIPSNSDTKMLDELYALIGNFVNNKIDTSYSSAKTDTNWDENSSEYSWDHLMQNISGTWPTDVAKAINWSTDSTFTGKVKFTSHANLLTADSSTSDYSALLKNSVYDFLSEKTKPAEYGWALSAPTDTKVPGMVTEDAFNTNNANNPNTSKVKDEYKKITGFIQSLNRTSKSKAMYQVANAKQGIISFIDSDGIHFVRIEGYELMDDKILTAQTPISSDDFSKANSDEIKNAYYSAQALYNKLASDNDATKNSAASITSDFKDVEETQQNTTGIKYSDLNKSFGNKYLQFLANTSIPKAAGFGSPKYSYDLSSLLKDYSSKDITTESISQTPTMTMMLWNYFKALFGIDNDSQLFNWIASGANGDPVKPAKASEQSMLFDPLRNANWSDQTKNEFEERYEDYMTNVVLAEYSDYKRSTHSDKAIQDSYENADKDTSQITWKDPTVKDYNPSATWATTHSDDKDFYNTVGKNLNNSNNWKSHNSTDSADKAADNSKQRAYSETMEYKFDVKMSKFIPNKFALKGDEE